MEYLTVPTKQFSVFLLITLALVPRSSYEVAVKDIIPLKLALYNSTDKVKILTHLTFRNEVLDRNHSTCVEFYNTYCGHCRKFAPSYKELAERLYSWRDILPVSAIDCAVEENNGICREYEVMLYPTLRYFGPAYRPSEGNYGKPITSLDLDEITQKLVEFVAAENKTSNMPSWPDLEEVQVFNKQLLFEGLDSLKKYVVLVYEPKGSNVGLETIFNFLRYPNIAVKRITDPELAEKYQIDGTKYKIAIVNRQGFIVPYAPQHNTSSSYKETIISFLNSEHITEKPDIKKVTESTSSIALTDAGEGNGKTLKIIREVQKNKHLIYQADLEMAIRTVVHNEIPKASHITGEKLLALQRFLTVLKRYNPMGANGRLMVERLATFADSHKEALSGEDFENKVKELNKELEPIYAYTDFVGCTGSQPGLRGFTCSLWQLFHFMSVQAANKATNDHPLEVLEAMHGYIKYFFGCTECSEHFQAMASRRKLWSTRSANEAVLWLWESHNEVNDRLAGDATDDPEFPKIQFPSRSSCSQCHKQPESLATANMEDKWNKTNVLQFLKNIHNPEHISHYALENADILTQMRQKRMTNAVFTDIDMRMGILLYGFCIVMLVAAFKLFVARGVYRKKFGSHDMLGKV